MEDRSLGTCASGRRHFIAFACSEVVASIVTGLDVVTPYLSVWTDDLVDTLLLSTVPRSVLTDAVSAVAGDFSACFVDLI